MGKYIDLEKEIHDYILSKGVNPVVFLGTYEKDVIGFYNGSATNADYEKEIHKLINDHIKLARKTNV